VKPRLAAVLVAEVAGIVNDRTVEMLANRVNSIAEEEATEIAARARARGE